MKTITKNIFLRTLLCTLLSLAWVGVKAQQGTTYTVYFNDEANWGGVYAYVFSQQQYDPWGIETYYVGTENNPTQLTEKDSNGYYICSFTTSDDLSNKWMKVQFGYNEYGWSWEDFTNGAVYTNGTSGGDTGTWTFNPANGTSGLQSLSSFTVTYSGGLSFGNSSQWWPWVSVKSSNQNEWDTYCSAQCESISGNTATFNFYESDYSTTKTITESGTYTITIDQGFFSLGDGATNDAITLTYTIGESTGGGKYTFYFDWCCIYWGSQIYAVVYYYDDSGNKTYCLGSEQWENVTWVGGTTVAENVYAWSFDTDIPEGKTAYVEIYSPDGGWSMKATEFVNEYIYARQSNDNGVSYPYGVFSYDEYYGTGNPHTGTVPISTLSVAHKDPKWSKEVDSSHDTFNKDVKRVNDYGNNLSGDGLLQAANIYVDTLYVMKGSTIQLTLPYTLGDGVGSSAYHRWFDFRTDGNYRYGNDDDLLRPTGRTSYADWDCIYRFANGYVCGSGNVDVMCSNAIYAMDFHYPTDSEFSEYSSAASGQTGYMKQPDNDFYIVACDVSPYTDFNWIDNNNGTGSYTEPTLAGRAILYVIGIDPESTSTTPPSSLPEELTTMWKLRDSNYQGGSNNGTEKYLEEYDIVFPARRTSNKTLELVTLSKDASSYIVPGVNDSPNTQLNVAIYTGTGATNGNFVLASSSLTGTNRVLQFYNTGSYNEYSNAANGAPWKVEDGTELTILVTKTVNSTVYNIARYHLTFKENATPLTQTQVAGLGTDEVNSSSYWWKDMTYRQPSYMNKNYNKIASLTFNFGSSSDVSAFDHDAQSGFHYFPMDWEDTSYAFYDGSTGVGGGCYDWYAPGTTILGTEGVGENHLTPTRSVYTQWSMYSLVNVYIGYGDSNIITETDWNNSHEYPQGSGTWVPDTTYAYGNGLRPEKYKPQGQEDDYWLYIDASDRPGSVAEISFDDPICVGTQVFGTALIKSASEPTSDDAAVLFSIVGIDEDGNHTTLYSQCSSQIRMTTYMNDSDNSYAYDVDENDLSSSVTGKGSDKNEWFQLYFSFYSTEQQNFDSYALKIDNYCSSTSGGDYYFDDIELYIVQPEFIVEQIAPICTTDEQASAVRLMVDFEMLEAHNNDDPTATNTSDAVDFMIIDVSKYDEYIAQNGGTTTDQIAAALAYATVPFVYEEGEEKKEANYITLKYYEVYTENTEYDKTNEGTNTPTNYDGSDYFFRYTVGDENYFAIDVLADISPYKAYKILLLHDMESMTSENYATLFVSCLEGTCEIASDFYLTSSTILKVNGEAVDPTVDYCAGQTIVIWPEVTYTASDGTTVTLGDEYFDWFFGTEEEYTEENSEYGVSLEKALLMFRHFYPTATELEESMKNTTDDEGNTFTENMYNIIDYYLNQTNEGSSHARLVLYQQKFNVVIPTTELDLVVQPIEVEVTDESGEPVEICFGYVPLTLSVGGNAPTLNAGFHNVVYPGDDFVPNIRLGLSQVNQASQAKSGSDTATPITVNLRNATYYEDGETETEVNHLGVYTSDDGTMNGLYLVGTNDPAYEEALSDEYFTQYDLPIGKVLDLFAIEDDTDGSSYMKLAFYDDYTLREGYSYIVLVNCEEKDEYGRSVNGVCQGSLPIELKIVPEYLVWQGNTSSNWNDDSNWLRADKDELNKPEGDPYPTNSENTTSNGLVPMLFSKVVIPEDKTAELYMAGFKEDSSDETFSWTGDESTATHDDVTDSPTENIMYDLMVYDTKDAYSGAVESMQTERYRVNLCRQLHLAPGAQLLHSELLIVDTVWTEVKIPQGEWQLVATPLQGVASGDWYTKSASGTETAEYFTDITFSTTDNNRYDPDIYQRSWDKTGTIVVSTDSPTSSTDRTTPAYASTGWTSAYNDASESFTSGVGYSLEGWSSAESTDSIMFRFPKADTSYEYSTGTLNDNHGTGTLLISSLVDRSDPDEDMKDDGVYKEGGITVTLPEKTLTDNNYYLIGNPFTAPMSMAQFMDANTNIKGYWTGDDNGPIAGNGEGTSSGDNDYLLPPYSGFFVTTSESDISPVADSPLIVYFTENMQTLGEEAGDVSPAPSHFAIRATNSVGTSGASLSYDDSATDGYDASEDVILLEDDSWMREGLPMVYTVAGDMAVSINTLSTSTTIPIGAFADDDCAYTLTFVGLDNLIEPVLYDAYALTETPLTEGFTLDLTGASHGQYFIRVAAPTPTGITEDYTPTYDITAYSPTQGTIIVSSSATLEDIDVYSVGGMLLRQVNAGGNISCTINGINSGVAIVRARTSEGTFVKKLRVR